MDKFMEFIVLYGFVLGLILGAFYFIIFFKKINGTDDAGGATTHLLPFIGAGLLFSVTGLSVVIKSIYDNEMGSDNFYSGLIFSIPIVIILFFYIINKVKEVKAERIYAQDQKYIKW
jgi:hypothetical protein